MYVCILYATMGILCSDSTYKQRLRVNSPKWFHVWDSFYEFHVDSNHHITNNWFQRHPMPKELTLHEACSHFFPSNFEYRNLSAGLAVDFLACTWLMPCWLHCFSKCLQKLDFSGTEPSQAAIDSPTALHRSQGAGLWCRGWASLVWECRLCRGIWCCRPASSSRCSRSTVETPSES